MEKETCCCNAETCTCSKDSVLHIAVLGSGCSRCKALEAAVNEAVEELHLNAEISHITDYAEIASYGIMSTPGLAVNGSIVSAGIVLTKAQIIDILKPYAE